MRSRSVGIDENWLFGLAAHESGWLDRHDRERNDPFGVTHGGGANVRYPSIAAAIAYWERRYGPVVRGAASAPALCSGSTLIITIQLTLTGLRT